MLPFFCSNLLKVNTTIICGKRKNVENALPKNIGIFAVLVICRTAAVVACTVGNIIPTADQVKDIGALVHNTLSASRRCDKVTVVNMKKLWGFGGRLVNSPSGASKYLLARRSKLTLSTVHRDGAHVSQRMVAS